ncbi:MAG: rhodanese [Verrucomicrobia bacterium]|nr:rhodanese [Verrucomicrobiota bacterium]
MDEAATSPPLEISAQEARRWLDDAGAALRVIDCRDPEEFAFNRLPGAELLPLSTLPSEARTRLGEPTDAPLLVYCHHGMRSARAAHILRQLGYRGARSLAGGIDRWSLEIDPTMPRY